MTSFEVPKQHPFSLYDFIGYFIPGAVFLFLLILFDTGKDGFCAICNFVDNLSIACDKSFLHTISTFVFFFAISYIFGHIISILSNIIIEKSGICRYHNFLSYILLEQNNRNEIRKEGNKLYNFILFYIYFYEYVFSIFQKIFAYKKIDCEQYIFDDIRHSKLIEKTPREIIEKSIKDVFKKYFEKTIEDDFFKVTESKKDNFFEVLYHYVIENGSNHLYKIQNYVALYGFMRNMSMVFCILFWFTLVAVILNFIGIIKLTWPHLNELLLFVYSFCGFLTMIGLHKYKKRYTLEVLMAAAVLSKKNAD